MEILNQLHWYDWAVAGTGTFLLGFSKAGIRGIDILIVTLVALVFGGKASTGILLPILSMADILAVAYYKRHVEWRYFKRLLPWILVGVLFGVWIGKDLNEAVFRKVISFIILLATVLMFWLDRRKSEDIPKNHFFAISMGLSAGITTMLGNLAGAFTNIYFLVERVPKTIFIGTAAWIFLVVNLFKIPFQVMYWDNISLATFKISLFLVPPMLLGFFIGVRIVKLIPNENYRKMILYLTLVGAVFIFFK